MSKILQLNPQKHISKTFSILEGSNAAYVEKVKRYTDGKVRFTTILQTCGDVNQNRRVYPLDVMQKAVMRILPTVKARNQLGELDHPIPSGENSQIRQTTVLYKESSHIITDIQFRDNEIWGEIETLPYTENGKILSGLVLDKVTIGFSLRGLADLEDSGTHQTVLDPLVIICWDVVQQPSHKKASIQEIRQEEMLRVVNESRTLNCKDGKCYLPNFINMIHKKSSKEEVITEKINDIFSKYWNPGL